MDPKRAALLLLHLARLAREPPWPLPDPHVLLSGDRAALEAEGLPRGDVERLLGLRERDVVRALTEATRRAGVRLLLHADAGFPRRLDGEPPITLAVWIDGELTEEGGVAIVGSRSATGPILDFTHDLAFRCAAAGRPVVSGLARGIDAAAHRGCLAAGGYAVGVLGTGIDRCYPPSHKGLHDRVRDSGCLVTPFPPGAPPRPHHFPRRNRILAALADTVIVVRAGERSGSLSTARAALDLGREVYAVPGSPTDPLSRGSNALLRDGAAPLTDPEDLPGLPAQGGASRAPNPGCGTAGLEERIVRSLGDLPLTLEEIAALARTSSAEARMHLLRLELSGLVERTGGGTYRRASRRGP